MLINKEIEQFTEEDEYCIEHFGYNTISYFNELKSKQDKNHLIIEELMYRIEQRDKIIEDMRECGYITTDEWLNRPNVELINLNLNGDDEW